MIRLTSGRFVATYDNFTNNTHGCSVMVSDDAGKTWQRQAEIAIQWASPFLVGDALYLLGNTIGSRHISIARSLDGGETWSDVQILFEGEHTGGCVSIVKKDGHVYRAFERMHEPLDEITNNWASVVVAGDLSKDLLDRGTWRRSNEVPFPGVPPQLTRGLYVHDDRIQKGRDGWLEGNVVEKDDRLHVLLRTRFQTQSTANMTSICEITDDGEQLENRFLQYYPMPGGQNKFHILRDPQTGLYWTATSQVTDSFRDVEPLLGIGFKGTGGNERRIQVLMYSVDALHWFQAGFVAFSPDLLGAFNYAWLLVDGDDLLVLCRTSREGLNNHDSNLITFHRVENFRQLVPDGLFEPNRPPAERPGSGAEKPNIIFLLADDLGYGDLGCYGQKHIRTLNIDRLAREGMRFTHCYSGSPYCAPSRSVLMTGQHCGHTRVRGNFGNRGGTPPEGRVPLAPNDVTVAEVLKGAGYQTAITGKWGLGEPETRGIPNVQGFDEWLGYLNQNRADHYYTTYVWKNREKLVLHGNDGKSGTQYTQDVFTDFALDFIRRNRDRPFFLYVPWTIPHQNYEVPSLEPYADKTDWTEFEKTYAAMVTRLDGDVGRILDLLEELDLDRRTIVFFSSDNGASKVLEESRFDSWRGLRGTKGTLYEGGIRVPMVVRWPGKVPGGVVNESLWSFADFLPTAAGLGGTRAPRSVDGINVLPTLLGKKQELADRVFYWENHTSERFGQALRWGNWKVLREDSSLPLELYNLRLDPGESRDLAREEAAVVERLETRMMAERTESPYWQ
jgi:arylsulfatase A-like enzyme